MCPGFAAQTLTRLLFHCIRGPVSLRPKAAAGIFAPWSQTYPCPLLLQHGHIFVIFNPSQVENLPLPKKQIFGPKAHPFPKLGLFPVTPSFEQKLLFNPFGETLTLNAHEKFRSNRRTRGGSLPCFIESCTLVVSRRL